jgi:hypothetical protein
MAKTLAQGARGVGPRAGVNTREGPSGCRHHVHLNLRSALASAYFLGADFDSCLPAGRTAPILRTSGFPKADRHAGAVKAAIVVARPSKARVGNGDSSGIHNEEAHRKLFRSSGSSR